MMGLFQKALETYDTYSDLAGESIASQEMLAPIAHQMTKADIEITLDRNGKFQEAHKALKEDPAIPIPVTESSGGRTGKVVAPHPLCDQLKYLAPFGGEGYKSYVKQLEEWNDSPFSHPKLGPILTYVKSGMILQDLSEAGVIQLKANGLPKDEKLLVRWRVLLHDGKDSACWTDKELFKAFTDGYLQKKSEEEKYLCMISGDITAKTENHPKKIVENQANAKLISANDEVGFTFRGRFSEKWQAATVGYVASQKAHNALRWVIANQGKTYGDWTFVCWSPQHIESLPSPGDPLAQWEEENEPTTMEDYRKKLKNTLLNKKGENLYETARGATVVFAGFDPATKGRLALTEYHEFLLSDYLQRLYQWDRLCCWENGKNGKFYIQSPSLPRLVNNAFGTPRKTQLNNGKEFIEMKTDDKLFHVQLRRMIAVRLSGAWIPADIVRVLVNRASSPQSYDYDCWRSVLFTACAGVKKYRFDRLKEEWDVTLEEKNKDTSYLFGRLLAIAEKVERDTYNRRKDKEDETDETREASEVRMPNAIRMMTMFSRRPLHTWRLLTDKLTPYYARLDRKFPGASDYYQKMIQDIFVTLDESGKDLNRPLDDIYLLGYYSQRKALYTKKEEQNKEE